MDKSSKYQFEETEVGSVYWDFCTWLEKNAPPEAADTFKALADAQILAGVFGPGSTLTLAQQEWITTTKKNLAKADAWLKEQQAQPA